MSISILLVDDHPMFRAGVRSLVDAEPDMVVVGEVDDERSAIDRVQALTPDLVMLAINTTSVEDVNEVQRIKLRSPDTRLLVLTMHIERKMIERLLRAGAAGCLRKECAPEELLNGIRGVAKGKRYLDLETKDLLVARYVDTLTGELGEEALISAMEGGETGIPLYTTKLHRPQNAQYLVPRARLIEELEIGRQRPFTLVSAPAGFGKSTLVSQWLENCDWPSAWLSLDEQDNDLRVFFTYLIAAVKTQFPKALPMTSLLLQAPSLPDLPSLVGTFVNELDHLPQRFILVLDDYHRISEPAIRNLLAELLRHPPQTLHLVLVSRTDPTLNLLRLRAYQQMGEVRTQALSFTAEETAALLQQVVGTPVDAGIAQALTEKTEGWVTGLHLVTLSVRDSADLADVSNILPGEQQTLDYLIAEVLSRQPDHVQAWLLKTAILDRFCASLCAAVCASPDDGEAALLDGREFIRWLAARNLFVISLDSQGTWFRYHHLFQELLQVQLGYGLDAGEIADLHSRASRWFREQGQANEAFDHALAAGDVAAAVEIVETDRHSISESGDFHVVEHWLKRLPAEVVEQRPALLMANAWVAYSQFQMERIPPIVEQVEVLLDDGADRNSADDQGAAPVLQGELNFFRGNLLYWGGDPETSVRYLEKALEQIPDRPWGVNCNTELILGLARHSSGQSASAVEALNDWIRSAEPLHDFQMTYLFGSLTFIHLLSAQLIQAADFAQRMEAVAKTNSNGSLLAWNTYLLACTYLHRYDLNRAAHAFAETVRLRHVLDTRAAIEALAALALTQQLLQRPEDALKTMDLLLEFIQGMDEAEGLAVAHGCQARLALLNGDLTAATRWSRSINEKPSQTAFFVWAEVPCISQARVLIAVGSKESLRQAADLLRHIRDVSHACRFVNQTVEAAVLQSLCLERQRRSREALEALAEAVMLTEAGGWVRPFVELGQPMANLLGRLRRENIAGNMTTYIDQILSAYPDWNESPDQSGLIEPVTERELQILRMLATEFSAKEIADELVVSIATVRAHTRSIYGKLDVHSRHEAAQRARDLGLL